MSLPTGLVFSGSATDAALLEDALARLGPELATLFARDGVSVRFLKPGETFATVAREYRRADNMNFAICKGLYDPGEHCVVIAVPDLTTVVHELLHHVDHRLATDKIYHSRENDQIQRTYREFRQNGFTVSQYAMADATEFTAECWRSLWANAQPTGRRTDRERLAMIRPELLELFESLTARARALVADVPAAA